MCLLKLEYLLVLQFLCRCKLGTFWLMELFIWNFILEEKKVDFSSDSVCIHFGKKQS